MRIKSFDGMRRLLRRSVMVLADAGSAAFALLGAVLLRMNGDVPPAMWDHLLFALPVTAVVAALIFRATGIYLRAWRYTSVIDVVSVVPAATLAIAGSLAVLVTVGETHWLPLSVPVIQWFILVVLLCAMRVVRRIVRERNQGEPAAPTGKGGGGIRRVLLVGTSDRVEIALRHLQVGDEARYRAVGIIDRSGQDLRMRIRGVPVLGGLDAVEQVVNKLDAVGLRPDYILLVDGTSALTGPEMVRLVAKAEILGLKVGRVANTAGLETTPTGRLDLSFIDLAALLGRPQIVRDPAIARVAVAGRRVLVTGAGGTIGSELVRQIAAHGPAELVLLDHCEYNLYAIDLEMHENFPGLTRHPVLCSIRQRDCLMNAFETYTPEIVFHAAALKHVPLVEVNPCAGVLTNVLGTRNVADAARRFGVQAMVQVSTDKAVNPVGIMGATKRLGELYCQALDLACANDPTTPRFLTVRFGNVLGSSGSLIPLLQRQLSRRAPLTVTHAQIERYFMTVHEAVQLILQSTAQAVASDVRRGRIFVLDMGEPIKIIDIARRMIRLAGLEPDVDVRIDIVGLRPGEKLYEELFDTSEKRLASTLPGIMEAEPAPVPLARLNQLFNQLEVAALGDHADTVRQLIHAAVSPEAAPRPAPVLVKPDITVWANDDGAVVREAAV